MRFISENKTYNFQEEVDVWPLVNEESHRMSVDYNLRNKTKVTTSCSLHALITTTMKQLFPEPQDTAKFIQTKHDASGKERPYSL